MSNALLHYCVNGKIVTNIWYRDRVKMLFFGGFFMTEEHEIVKELKEEEKLGLLQSQSRSTYKEQHIPEESLDKTPPESSYKDEDDLKTTRKCIELGSIEEKYHTLFDNYAVAITLADDEERIVSWNKYAEELF
ncbi:PAS domain-containing protein [Thermoplasmatales archaeon SCGC AB-540-F20]|nr:PAS domain-containing protein [Thermoplasmatales archaeon SCGC AB-540-F20]